MGKTVREVYSPFERWRLRQVTNLRGIVSQRPRIIFIHIPKTAGTTVTAHLRACIGSKSSGRSVGVNDMPFQPSPIEERLDRAQKAQVVHGHIAWSSIELLDHANTFKFIFLRSPVSRLKSLYGFLSYYPEWATKDRVKPLLDACQGCSPQQLANSQNPAILSLADNYIVRQLAGSVQDYPVRPDAWPGLFEEAKKNLASLDFIGMQENFDRDFAHVLDKLRLPKAGASKTLNKTVAKGKFSIDVNPALYEWDQKLFKSFMPRNKSALDAGYHN